MMRTKRRNLDARDRTIVRRVKSGDNIAEIARDAGLRSRARVRQIAEAAGVPPRAKPLHLRITTTNESTIAQRRVELGWSHEELAAEAGLSRRTVQWVEVGRGSADSRTAVIKALQRGQG